MDLGVILKVLLFGDFQTCIAQILTSKLIKIMKERLILWDHNFVGNIALNNR